MQRSIPFYKVGRKIYYKLSEINEWIEKAKVNQYKSVVSNHWRDYLRIKQPDQEGLRLIISLQLEYLVFAYVLISF